MSQRYVFNWILPCLILTSIAGSIQAVQFTTQPSNVSLPNGAEIVVLECSVDTADKISWFKNGSPVTEDFRKYTVTKAGLRIKPVEKSDAGDYYCKVGALQSRTATLTVEYICKDGFQIKTSGSAFRGEDFTLTCGCAAVPAPTYTWEKDGSTLKNFTGKDLVITNAQKTKDDGQYVCTAESRGTKKKSLPHNLDVFNCSPARIVSPPDQEILFVVKKPLNIKCDATGDPTPDVEWYQGSSSTALKNTSRIQIFQDGTLHFTKMQADDVGEYRCFAKNFCDQSKTYTTKLVKAKIGKFSPMADSLNRVRSTVSITCNPPGESIPPIKNITWQRANGKSLPTDSRFKVTGNTLQIEKAKKADSGVYTCVAENIAGKRTVDVEVIVAIYPEVTLDPVNKTVMEGESVNLECKFSGDPKPKITWEKNGKTLPEDADITIKNTTNGSILSISNAVGDQTGLYRCSATLKHVTERTKEAKLFVKAKIVLNKIGSAKFDEGTIARLNCRIVAGTGPYEIRWEKEGLKNGLLPHMSVEGSKLVINKATMNDTGNYTCYINNSFSSAKLRFSINVYDYTVIVSHPRNVTVMVNDSAMFNCKATGKPKPGVIWYEEKGADEWKQIVYDSRVVRLDNDSLLLKSVKKRDARQYKCMAGNPGLIVEAMAFLRIGSGNEKPISPYTPKGDTDEHDADNMGKTVGIAVGCAGAYIILVVGLMIYCKGRRARQAKKKLIINGEDIPLKPDENGDNIEVVKTPEVANARPFSRANLETLRTLGSGTYGNVFLAKASEIIEGESSSIVVVQSLTANDDAVRRDFMRRMEMLSLKHENIAKLLGVCQEEEPMYLISEYPEQGDLKTVMRDSSSPLSPTQKLNICAAVASGMNYLTTHGHVHKDLAARNCLVNKSFHVKISFLSLNQGTYPKEYYKRGEELIPLRWMAPEALNGEYSDMSDVWSFGVLMWEVYTEGILPYGERPDEEVLHSVADDLRLTKPEGCPGRIYKMMEKCWADDKEDRLTFGQLCEDISEIPRESDF